MTLPPGIVPLPNTTDLVVLSDTHNLLIKRYYPLVIRLDFPKGLQPGQSVSNFQLLMQIKKNLEAHKLMLLSGRVMESTVEYVKFHALMENQDAIDRATRRLLKQKIKAATFKTPLSVNVEKVRMLSQSERDWESYFDKTEGMDPKVPGKRPDTLYLSKLPIDWFRHRDSLPDENVFKKIFSKFGEVRAVDIPRADRFRSKMSADISGIRTGTLVDHQDTTFEAYVQFMDYPGFATAMKFFGGYAKLVWRGHNGNGTGYLQADIVVDFNRDCHLCPEKIKRRSEERRMLKQKEQEEQNALKENEEEKKRKCEEEEKCAKTEIEVERKAPVDETKKNVVAVDGTEAKRKPEENHEEKPKGSREKEREVPAKRSEEKSHERRRYSDSRKRYSMDESHSFSKSSSERKRTSDSSFSKPSSDRKRSSDSSFSKSCPERKRNSGSSLSKSSSERKRTPESSSKSHEGSSARSSRSLRRHTSHSERKASPSHSKRESRAPEDKRRRLSNGDEYRRSRREDNHRKHSKPFSEKSHHREVDREDRKPKPDKNGEKEMGPDERKEQELRELLLQEREKQLRAKLLGMSTNGDAEAEGEKMEVQEDDNEEELRAYLLQKQEEKLRAQALQTLLASKNPSPEEEAPREAEPALDQEADEELELRKQLLQQREQALRAKLTQMAPKSIS